MYTIPPTNREEPWIKDFKYKKEKVTFQTPITRPFVTISTIITIKIAFKRVFRDFSIDEFKSKSQHFQ